MKNIFLVAGLFLAFSPTILFAQNKSIDKLFRDYEDHESFTYVDVKGGLFEILGEIDADNDEDIEELKEVVNGLESLRLLSCQIHNEGNQDIVSKFITDVNNAVPFDKYHELMMIKDKDVDVKFYAINEGSTIRDAILIVEGANEAVFINVLGDINLQNLVKLGSSFNYYQGMEYFKALEEE